MKKVNVSIMYDGEKLSAVKLYMEQRDIDVKSELEKALDTLYAKYVPANVREFIDLKCSAQTPSRPKSSRPKPSENKSEVKENV
ncbi:DUF6103 family protein [Ruminococcus sp. zg-924]|uniref:DUF6103 family protein n=1 Tax=Ruminococcus sp. zg-924 TaxID=2678505 RepID=UPI002109C219|nr:DUF6103 family protein [Ruminococcus sp. zg-924]MCQ4022845.1 hypothetical protein [Ruminococcus sp. zg-924]